MERTEATGLRGFIVSTVLFAVITIGVTGCGVSEPPLPSAPLPFPAATVAAPDPKPSATATLPTSAPTSDTGTAVPSPDLTKPDGVTLAITIAQSASDIPKYNRREWRHWIDANGDCQDARQESLIAESQSSVVYETEDKCRVESGEWLGMYTGRAFTDPSELDIDHMVPLANAHRSGGWAWPKERKAAFANDLSYDNHLIAVQASANRQKGSKGPEDWKPPRREYWCQYAIDWATIKGAWGLTATQREADALQDMLATCDEPATLLRSVAKDAPLGGHTSTPVSGEQAPMPPPGGSLRYDPAGPDRDCGDFDTWEEAQAFYIAAGGPDTDRHRLDGNMDGVACNSLR